MLFRSFTLPYQPSPITLPGRPAHCPFRGLLGVHSRYGLHTRAVTVFRDTLSEGFSHFVTSMTAPVASGWSVRRVGFATHWKAPPCHGAGAKQTFCADCVVKCAAATLSRLAYRRRPTQQLRQLGEVHRHRAAPRRASADLVAERCDAAICPESGEKRKRARRRRRCQWLGRTASRQHRGLRRALHFSNTKLRSCCFDRFQRPRQ